MTLKAKYMNTLGKCIAVWLVKTTRKKHYMNYLLFKSTYLISWSQILANFYWWWSRRGHPYSFIMMQWTVGWRHWCRWWWWMGWLLQICAIKQLFQYYDINFLTPLSSVRLISQLKISCNFRNTWGRFM